MTILEDVAVLLGRALTTPEETRAARLADIAAATVESEIPGFTLAAGTETATIYPGAPDVVWTPRYPVTDVASVTAGGNAITGYAWTEHGCISLAAVLPVDDWELNLGVASAVPVDVTYDYGFVSLPADISAAIAAPIANVLRQQATNANLVQSKAIGDVQISYGDFAVRQAMVGLVAPMVAGSWRRHRQFSAPLVPAGVYPGGLQAQSGGS